MQGLIFSDPACGSGNFLTETYISLRKIENQIIFHIQEAKASHYAAMIGGQIVLGDSGFPSDPADHDFHAGHFQGTVGFIQRDKKAFPFHGIGAPVSDQIVQCCFG